MKNDPNEVYTILQAGGAGDNVIMRRKSCKQRHRQKLRHRVYYRKFMSRNYYLLFNLTFYRSTYTNGFNKKEWSTVFDGKYLFNLASGYELPLKKGRTLIADIKGSLAGGTRYTPVIKELCTQNQIVIDKSRVNELQLRDYFRIDLRIGYRRNKKTYTEELAVDLQNLTNHRNIYTIAYDVESDSFKEALLQGFTPMVTYRINFSL